MANGEPTFLNEFLESLVHGESWCLVEYAAHILTAPVKGSPSPYYPHMGDPPRPLAPLFALVPWPAAGSAGSGAAARANDHSPILGE